MKYRLVQLILRTIKISVILKGIFMLKIVHENMLMMVRNWKCLLLGFWRIWIVWQEVGQD